MYYVDIKNTHFKIVQTPLSYFKHTKSHSSYSELGSVYIVQCITYYIHRRAIADIGEFLTF